MNLARFNRILQQALLLPVVALLVAAGALYLQIRGANDTVGTIQTADSRITQASVVGRLIADEESGLRGYETTGDERFLQPFNEAGERLPAEFNKLRSLTESDPQQLYNVEDLRNEHQTWHDAFALPIIALARAGGQTNDVNLNLYGKSLMDQVRKDIEAIERRAEARRTDRIEQWRKQLHNMLVALVVIALGMGVLIGLFMRNRLHAVSSAYSSSLEILRKRAEEIYQSEQKLRTTLDSIAEGVITCDADGQIQMFNPVASELTGWLQSEAVGRPLKEVLTVLDENSRKPLSVLDGRVRQGLSANSWNTALLVRRDQSQLLTATSSAEVRDQTGATVGLVIVVRDITMERRTQEALLANEKLAVAGRLAATIAHEIHNPLDSVSNILYLMKSGASQEEFAQFIDMAERELARVTHISRAMLGLYRESKAPVPVDLKQILEDVLLLMEHRFHELGVSVESTLPKAIVVDAFPAELRQVFTNLMANAAEAAAQGGHKVSVSAWSTMGGVNADGQNIPPGATIIVADNGGGIPEDIKPHLFQPFFSTKGERGTGLGLWVSRGIVHKHGGTISLENPPQGQGTSVRIFLAEKPTMGTPQA